MWKFFILLIVLEIVLDFNTSQTYQCLIDNHAVILPLIIHHIANGFLLYGWILIHRVFLFAHLIIVIAIIVYWKTNNNRCDLTIYVNRLCHWHKDKPFHDLLDMIGLKSTYLWNEYGHYLFITFGAVISLWKIIQ